MRYELFIAIRYLFSKKKHNTINLVTWVSMVGVAISTIALIIVLSVLNGFENVVKESFSAFDPELKIIPADGKFFSSEDSLIILAKKQCKFTVWSEVLEQDGLVSFNDQQTPVTIKGIDENFVNVAGIEDLIWDGSMDFNNIYKNQIPSAIGIGLSQKLNANVDQLKSLSLYSPKRKKINLARPEQNFTKTNFVCNAIFSVQQIKYDENLILMPINDVRKAYQLDEHDVTSIEIRISDYTKQTNDDEINKAKIDFSNVLGKEFLVLDRYQQQADFYKISKIEKWTTFMILSFILLIATFNIVGSLSMIIIEKRENIELFNSLGATKKQIKKLFVIEGFSISVLGAIIGTILGVLVVLIQQQYGIIKIGAGFLTQVYPVQLQLFDIICVISIVLLLGYLAALYTTRSQLKSLK